MEVYRNKKPLKLFWWEHRNVLRYFLAFLFIYYDTLPHSKFVLHFISLKKFFFIIFPFAAKKKTPEAKWKYIRSIIQAIFLVFVNLFT